MDVFHNNPKEHYLDNLAPVQGSPDSVVKYDSLEHFIVQFTTLSQKTYVEAFYQESLDAADRALYYCTRSKTTCNHHLPTIHRCIAMASAKLGHTVLSVRHWQHVVNLVDEQAKDRILCENDKADLITALEALAQLLRKSDEADETLEQVLLRLISLYEASNLPNPLRMAVALSSLSRLHAVRGRVELALQEEERSLVLRRDVYGSTRRDVADCLHRIAVLRLSQGDAGARTETFLHEAVLVLSTLGLAVSESTAAVMSTLSELHLLRDDVVRAEGVQERVVALLRRICTDAGSGKCIPTARLVSSQWRLAALVRRRGDVERARDVRVEVLGSLRVLRGGEGAGGDSQYVKYWSAHEELCARDGVETSPSPSRTSVLG